MKELEQWRISLIVKGKSELTIKAYIGDLELFFKWFKLTKQINSIDIKIIQSITLMDFDKFMEYLIVERNNSAATRSRRTNAIKEFFRFLKKNKLIQENVTEDLECPKIPKKEMPFLSERECLDLIYKIQGCHRTRDIAIITMFLNTGLRLSELVNININDIKDDFSIKIIGKGNKERIIYLNDVVLKTLNDWLRIRPDAKDQPALFISERKNRISIKAVQFMVKENLKRIGREDCYVHALRHSFCTLMLKKGANIRAIQEAAGHSSITTTEKYTHIVKSQVEEAINKINIGWEVNLQ